MSRLTAFFSACVFGLATLAGLTAQVRSDNEQVKDSSTKQHQKCDPALRRTPPAVLSSPKIGEFVLYAERSIFIGRHDVLCGGDVGVRSVATGLPFQLTVESDVFSDLSHNLLAPSVALREDTRVGTVQANTLNAQATLPGFPSLAMPALPLGAPPVVGKVDVTVPRHIEYGLVPGTYNNLDVEGAVLLTQGDYIFSQVKLGGAAKLIAMTPGVRVLVQKTLVTGPDVAIRPLLKQPAANLFISVAGSDASTERETVGQPTVNIGPRSKIRAIVSVPHGTLAIDDDVEAAGAFAGFDIRLGENVHIDFQSGISESQADPHGQQRLSGYFAVPQDPGVTPVIGPVPPSTEVRLTISLPVRDAAKLQDLANQVSDPKSPNFRKYLTVDQFATEFGPSPADYHALTAWAQGAGFTVDAAYRNNMLISVGATAEQIERALYTNLVYRLRRDGSKFVTVDRDPSLDFNIPILRITGLNEVIPPTPGFHQDLSANHPAPDPGSGPGGLFGGNDFRAAYAPGVTEKGNGQTLALLEFDGFFPGDVTAYRNTFGLPNVTTQVRLLDKVSGSPGGANGEVALDIGMAMSMAPGLDAIMVYEGKLQNSIYGAIAAPNGDPLSLQVSASWTYSVDSTTQQLLTEMAVQGQSLFVSAGDCGAYPADPNDDRDLPFTTVVGGTNLAMNGNGASYQSEAAWSQGGGGILSGPSPAFQKTLPATNGVLPQFRNLPDVAAVASGVASASNGTGNLLFTVGTSISAPLWAGFTALANERAQKAGKASVGFANPVIYSIGTSAKYATNFNDVTSGSNPTSAATVAPAPVCPTPPSTAQFFAGTGYDLTTGWGSPHATLVTNLSQALSNIKSLTMIIGTGNDNARSDTELQGSLPGVPAICLKPSNNADADSTCPNGGSARDQQGNQSWDNFTTSTQTFTLPTAVPASSLTTLNIQLFEHNNGGETDDNWDIQSITVIATDTAGNTAPLLNVGNPPNGDNCIVRLTGKIPSFTFNLSQGNPTNANPSIPPGSCPQSQ